MCEHSLPDIDVSPGVFCDPCLAPLIRTLNENGFQTVASCCGHGTRPGKVALADGTVFYIGDYTWHQRLAKAIHDEFGCPTGHECPRCLDVTPPTPEPDPIAELLENLAERQWRRMTRSSTPWDQLNESDRRACRAIVKPVLDDIFGHPAAEIEWAVVDRGRTIHIEGATCPADVLAGAHGHGATQVGVARRTVIRTPWQPINHEQENP